MEEKISIAIATYNGEKYILELLNSLLNQTVKPYEIVICDDKSTDATCKIVKSYCDEIPIRLIENNNNIGVNKNFEKAIQLCKGDYVMICDQDDIWLPEKIQVTLSHMKKMEKKYGNEIPILVTSNSELLQKTGIINLQSRPYFKQITEYKEFLFCYNFFCQGCTEMLNRALVEKLPPIPNDFRKFSYDSFIAIVALLTGKRCHIDQVLMLYRNHENKTSGEIKKSSRFISFLQKIYNSTFSFMGIPYKRQLNYADIIENYQVEVNDSKLKKDVQAVITYNKSNLRKKIMLIYSLQEVSGKMRIRQLLILFLTSPIRFFSKK